MAFTYRIHYATFVHDHTLHGSFTVECSLYKYCSTELLRKNDWYRPLISFTVTLYHKLNELTDISLSQFNNNMMFAVLFFKYKNNRLICNFINRVLLCHIYWMYLHGIWCMHFRGSTHYLLMHHQSHTFRSPYSGSLFLVFIFNMDLRVLNIGKLLEPIINSCITNAKNKTCRQDAFLTMSYLLYKYVLCFFCGALQLL